MATADTAASASEYVTSRLTEMCILLLLHHVTILRTYMQPTVTNGVTWSVCVGLSVGGSVLIMSPAKTAEPIKMPLRMWTQVGPRNHVLDRGPYPQWKGTNLKGGRGGPL